MYKNKILITFLFFTVFFAEAICQNHLNINDETVYIDETSHIENGFTPVYFKNISSDSIIILNVKSTYGGMIPVWNPDPILPNDQDSIRILIDLVNEECRTKRLTLLTENIVTNEQATTNLIVTWLCDATSTFEVDSDQVNIYPNPANDYINIQNAELFSTYRIINNDGALMQLGAVASKIYFHESIGKGIYSLMLSNEDDEWQINRLIKL